MYIAADLEFDAITFKLPMHSYQIETFLLEYRGRTRRGTIFFFDLPTPERAGDNDSLNTNSQDPVSASRLCESETA